MTATEIRPIHPAPSRLGQATAVEQSRAVAEVEAAIVVAMRHPRSVPAAIEAMREACKESRLAERAFFRFPRAGQTVSGPSVHLARELARVWGNFQYGIAELARDTDRSEMLAFAWDVQTNTRNSSTFIVPHARDTKNGVKPLTDMRDIYESNANAGARRVREAIYAVLPTWFTEEAKELCARTLADGGGVPLPQRIANAIEVFGNLGITVPQLEAKLGLPTARWTDQDVAQLRVIRQSLLRGEISKDDEFPAAQQRVTAEEITGNGHEPSGPAPSGPPAGQEPAAGPEAPRRPQSDVRVGASKRAVGKLDGLLRALELGTDEDIAALLEWQCGEPYAGTRSQVQLVTSFLEDHLQACQGDTAEAASAIWAQYRAVTEQDASETPEVTDG